MRERLSDFGDFAYGEGVSRKSIIAYTSGSLNLLRLTDHLASFVSVHGPPLRIVPLAHCD